MVAILFISPFLISPLGGYSARFRRDSRFNLLFENDLTCLVDSQTSDPCVWSLFRLFSSTCVHELPCRTAKHLQQDEQDGRIHPNFSEAQRWSWISWQTQHVLSMNLCSRSRFSLKGEWARKAACQINSTLRHPQAKQVVVIAKWVKSCDDAIFKTSCLRLMTSLA